MSPTTLNVSADTSLYHFGDNNFADWGDFFTYYVRPPFEDSDTKGSLSFGLAGSGYNFGKLEEIKIKLFIMF